MSKPIPEAEYNRKPLTKLIQAAKGEKDPYLGDIESREQRKIVPDAQVVSQHKREHDEKISKVFDPTNNFAIKCFKVFYVFVSVVCCLALISMLLLVVSYLPPFGSPENPTSNEVVEKYIEDGVQDTGAVNIVTGMILDYRAFDTFGESNVLFIATCTVLILMRNDKKKDKRKAAMEAKREQYYEPKDDSILQRITFLLFPVIVVYGIYVILNGHISPGGGFSGGAIIGAGLILYANAFGFEKVNRFFTEKTYKTVSFSALSFYCLAKSYSFFTGANHLESGIPLGNPGDILSSGLIFPLNICVGLVVACTMYAFYTLFRKGGF